jgi:hypothetical protein
MMLEFERFTFDQNVMGDKSCICNLNVMVSMVVNGMSTEEILRLILIGSPMTLAKPCGLPPG